MPARPLATSRHLIPSGRVYQFGPPPVLEPLPPLLPHRIQHHQEFADLDTSLDTPPGNFFDIVALLRCNSSNVLHHN